MVRMHGNSLHQLVDESPLLRFGGCLPQMLDIEVLEKPGDLLVALSDRECDPQPVFGDSLGLARCVGQR